eukprot:CAMPEP_0204111788 /NCGR_PEP_ID=MMETSP0361-20130328/2670_1 /ASSEMBLY_ACC=CAM_ASM_000343 /TAXON_ID=268821 /ORGANISM="Scrippsiella Hangoei, Strain SHTV-5" /LENGTH=467 /DNA_ID=CAMNT_0051061885 /DNA_START=324 /DNA_END=1722 /DNA_ORIENTATION=-
MSGSGVASTAVELADWVLPFSGAELASMAVALAVCAVLFSSGTELASTGIESVVSSGLLMSGICIASTAVELAVFNAWVLLCSGPRLASIAVELAVCAVLFSSSMGIESVEAMLMSGSGLASTAVELADWVLPFSGAELASMAVALAVELASIAGAGAELASMAGAGAELASMAGTAAELRSMAGAGAELASMARALAVSAVSLPSGPELASVAAVEPADVAVRVPFCSADECESMAVAIDGPPALFRSGAKPASLAIAAAAAAASSSKTGLVFKAVEFGVAAVWAVFSSGLVSLAVALAVSPVKLFSVPDLASVAVDFGVVAVWGLFCFGAGLDATGLRPDALFVLLAFVATVVLTFFGTGAIVLGASTLVGTAHGIRVVARVAAWGSETLVVDVADATPPIVLGEAAHRASAAAERRPDVPRLAADGARAAEGRAALEAGVWRPIRRLPLDRCVQQGTDGVAAEA